MDTKADTSVGTVEKARVELRRVAKDNAIKYKEAATCTATMITVEDAKKLWRS